MKTIVKYNTEFNADSVEWCPNPPHKNFFVCANYQLNPQTQKRIGKILLFSVTAKDGLKLWQTLDTAAVLDQKWCHSPINGYSTLGVANADHGIEVYKFIDNHLELVNFYKLDVSEEVLILSLDWSTGKYHDEPEIICSDSKGGCHIFAFTNNVLTLQSSYRGHSFEAWIAAFFYWDTNVFFTGGDDAVFLKYDKRCGLDPVMKNRTHEAGVTSIHCNAEKENVVATGSYDEKVRLWDLRSMKAPCACLLMPGPVWRLKWDPHNYRYLLAACMLGGAHVLDCNENNVEIVGSYYEHQSMTYGADWSYVEEDKCLQDYGENRLIATCSFYDNLLCISKCKI